MELTLKNRAGNVLASAIVGGAILAFLGAVVFLLPDASATQRGLLRFFIAVGAALLATFFLGGVVLHGTIYGNSVGASGGFVLFFLIQFVVNPWEAQATVADRVPTAVAASDKIKEAQTCLKALGMYSATPDGIPGTATRAAIAIFQKQAGMSPTGFVDDETLLRLRDSAQTRGATQRIEPELATGPRLTPAPVRGQASDRKSTRLNSSHRP